MSKKSTKKKIIEKNPVREESPILNAENNENTSGDISNIDNDSQTENQKTLNTEDSFYYALNHEIRRQMIKIIGSNGEASFTSFKRDLKASTGTLYHHLDVLKDLVTQNQKKKYILTPLGKHAFNSLSKNVDTIESTSIDQPKTNPRRFENLLNYLVPRKLFELLDEKPIFAVIFSVLILGLCFLLVSLGMINSSFIFFLPYEVQGSENLILLKIGLGFKFVIGVIIASVISDILCRFLFQKTENTKKFLIIYPFCVYPMLFYLILYDLIQSIEPIFAYNPLNKLIMFIFQFWSIVLLTYCIVKLKLVKLERGLIITLLIHYGAFSILLFSTF